MTLAQKREIIRHFMQGRNLISCLSDVYSFKEARVDSASDAIFKLEAVLRDYLNGKFTLEAKRETNMDTSKYGESGHRKCYTMARTMRKRKRKQQK